MTFAEDEKKENSKVLKVHFTIETRFPTAAAWKSREEVGSVCSHGAVEGLGENTFPRITDPQQEVCILMGDR